MQAHQIRRYVALARRALIRMRFLLPSLVGIAIAVLGVLVQDVIVDRSGPAMAPSLAAAPERASDPPVAHRARVRDLLGVVVASDMVEIAARAEGRVTTIAVQLGDRVERGAVLARIDDRNLRDELAAARAASHALLADRNKTANELAEAGERRLRSERLSHVLSEEELAKVRYEEKYATSRLQATRARLEEQQTRVTILLRSIEEAQVRAPFAGLIAARYVSPGATVSAGAPIVRLVSAGKTLVRFAIPEALGAQVHAGMAVEIEVEGTALPAALSGAIDKLAPEVDAASRMIVAEAHVVVPDGLSDIALAGRAARVHVHTAPAPGSAGPAGEESP